MGTPRGDRAQVCTCHWFTCDLCHGATQSFCHGCEKYVCIACDNDGFNLAAALGVDHEPFDHLREQTGGGEVHDEG